MPDGQSMNMSVWENLRAVDRKFTKQIVGKSYKGDSPNPTWIIMRLTDVLGPIGRNWGFEVEFDRVRLGAPHQITIEKTAQMTPPDASGKQHTLSRSERYEIIREEYHEVCIRFWQIDAATGQTRYFSSYGGTPMLYLTSKLKWMHDEDAAKKSLTDAYVKAASFLGCAADIFLGIFDDKYQPNPDGNAAPPEAQRQQPPPQQQQSGPPLAGQDGDMGFPPPQSSAPPAERSSTAGTGW